MLVQNSTIEQLLYLKLLKKVMGGTVLNFILQTKRQMNHVEVRQELRVYFALGADFIHFDPCFTKYLVDIHTAPLSLIRVHGKPLVENEDTEL